MSKALLEERSRLMADRKALNDAAQKEGRIFTADELTKLKGMKSRVDEISATLEEFADATTRENALKQATERACGLNDTATTPVMLGDDVESQIDYKDLRNYSLRNVILAQINKQPLDGIEGEVHKLFDAKLGSHPKGGIYVPTRLMAARVNMAMGFKSRGGNVFRPRAAAIDTTTGTGAVMSITSSEYIDALRNLNILGPMGCTFLDGLQGKFAIPRSSGLTVYWPGDGVAITAGANTLDQVLFTDHLVGGYQDVTRSFINQTSLSVENYIEEQLLRSISAGLCDAALAGTGGSNIPLGVLNATNCGLVTMTSSARATTGAVPTNLTGASMLWASMVAMETSLTAQNARIDNGSYVLSGPAAGVAKSTAKVSGMPVFIEEGGEINGYPVHVTNSLPATCGTNNASASALFVNGPDIVVGLWGGLSVLVDPYFLGTSGGIRIIAYQSADVELRQHASVARTFGIAV